MTRFRSQGSYRFPIAAVTLFLGFLCGPAGARGQTGGKAPAADAQNEAPFQLKASSNLVVLRVVVRDSQGKPVENLKKEDFKLFDRGKEQSISQFEVESSIPQPSTSNVVRSPGQAAPPPTTAVPGKSTIFYFDDLNSSDADMIQARDAADRYLSANLQPQDRVAIITSGEVLSDFTSDPKKIHEALFKLHASSRSLARAHYCPDLSDYQALQIVQNPNGDAMQAAADEAAHCDGGVLIPPGGMAGGGSGSVSNGGAGAGGGGLASSGGGGIAGATVRALAQNIVNQAEIQARTNMQQLEQVVKYIAQKPGQRTVILVSPGFMSASEQLQLDRLIDHALRSQVVISALDPKGLALLMSQTDTTRSYVPINPGMSESVHRLSSERELVATGVLADVAHGTGGEFFHNSNDLQGGFGALAGSPVYYILAFAPTDKKEDGKFHALKVTLTEKDKGVTVQARRGYFASKNDGEGAVEAAAPVPSAVKEAEPKKELAVLDPEAQAQEKIRQAILSKVDLRQLPVALDVKLPDAKGDTRDLALHAHLDTNFLHFRRDGDHNINTVTFVFAIFDQKDDLVNAQQRRAKLDVLDGQLVNLLNDGVDVSATFELKPGSYRIREVVAESEEHHMMTLSRDVDIP